MEPDEDTGQVDVLDDVLEAVVVPGGVGGAAVERERDLVGAEERIERRDDGGAVAGVRGRILGEVRRRSERLPGRVGHRLRVAVGVGQRDRLVGTPEPVVVLGVEAGDHRVPAGDVRHRQHPGGLHEAEAAVAREAEQAVVPLPDVVVGPEKRLLGLVGRSGRAVDPAELLDLVQVVGVLPGWSASWGRRAGTAMRS